MAFTLDQARARVREILQDSSTAGDNRYPDAQIAGAFNVAVGEMMRIRPDMPALRTAPSGYPYSASSFGQGIVLPFHDSFYGPFVAFVAGWISIADDEFATEGRAAALLSRFTSQLVVGG